MWQVNPKIKAINSIVAGLDRLSNNTSLSGIGYGKGDLTLFVANKLVINKIYGILLDSPKELLLYHGFRTKY